MFDQETISSTSQLNQEQHDMDSDHSEEFEILSNHENEQEAVKIGRQQINDGYIPVKKKELQTISGQHEQCQRQSHELKVKLQEQATLIQALKKQNIYLSQTYQDSLNHIKLVNYQLTETKIQNFSLKQQNSKIKQALQILKQQSHQYIDKINCLQQKSQLEKEEFERKFEVIRKNLQLITKKVYKNMDQISTLNYFVGTCQFIERIMSKIDEASNLIIENKKNKMQNQTEIIDILSQKYAKVDKIHNILIQQQVKITYLKEQVKKLEAQINENRTNSDGLSFNIGKFFDPVIKFCKIEEDRVFEYKDRKTKTNI